VPAEFFRILLRRRCGKGAIEFVDKSCVMVVRRSEDRDSTHMERDRSNTSRDRGRKRRGTVHRVISEPLSPGLEDDKYLTEDCQLTELIPCITLFDRPEHASLSFFNARSPDRAWLVVSCRDRRALDRSFIRDLTQRQGHSVSTDQSSWVLQLASNGSTTDASPCVPPNCPKPLPPRLQFKLRRRVHDVDEQRNALSAEIAHRPIACFASHDP